MENLSQNQQIRQHLEAGKSITPIEALNQFGCLRLGARIHNLKKMGLAITSRIIEQGGKHFAEYRLEESECHSRVRYAQTEKLIQSLKTGTLIVAIALFASCTTLRPGCAHQHRAVHQAQLEIQYEHSRPAFQDGLRYWRNWWERPQRMKRIPFTKLYIP